MQLLIYLAVVPCLVAALNITCPDLSTCPEGKTCCAKSSETYECCDIEEHKKKLFPGIPPNTISGTQSKKWSLSCLFCGGTCCTGGCCEHKVATCCSSYCCEGKDNTCCSTGCCRGKRATCCSDDETCCPRGNQCCQRAFSTKSEWCCPWSSMCSSTYGYCSGGPGSLIPGISSIGAVLFLLILGEKSFF